MKRFSPRALLFAVTGLVIAAGAVVVLSTSANASPNRSSEAGLYYCTPVRDGEPGMYCTPTEANRSNGWLPWWFGTNHPQPAPRPAVTPAPTLPPSTTAPRPTTTAPPTPTTVTVPPVTTRLPRPTLSPDAPPAEGGVTAVFPSDPPATPRP